MKDLSKILTTQENKNIIVMVGEFVLIEDDEETYEYTYTIKILRSSKPCMYAFEFENQDGTMLKDQLRNSIQKIFSQMETEAWVE